VSFVLVITPPFFEPALNSSLEPSPLGGQALARDAPPLASEVATFSPRLGCF